MLSRNLHPSVVRLFLSSVLRSDGFCAYYMSSYALHRYKFWRIGRTRISTHFRCTFMRTCKPSSSVSGPNTLIQSFFSGVIRWGGMGIRRVSDFFPAAEACAAADIGGNTGMPEVEGISVGSVSIMSSSSSSCCGGISCDPDPEGPSSLAISSSFSIGSLGSAVLGVFFIFLLVFFFATTCALDSAAATTIFRKASNIREAGFIWGYASKDQRSQVNSTVYARRENVSLRCSRVPGLIRYASLTLNILMKDGRQEPRRMFFRI